MNEHVLDFEYFEYCDLFDLYEETVKLNQVLQGSSESGTGSSYRIGTDNLEEESLKRNLYEDI